VAERISAVLPVYDVMSHSDQWRICTTTAGKIWIRQRRMKDGYRQEFARFFQAVCGPMLKFARQRFFVEPMRRRVVEGA